MMVDEAETSGNEIDIKLDSQVHFPMPRSSIKAKPKHKSILKKMPKKQSQKMRRTCDGDRMESERFDRVLAFRSGQNIVEQVAEAEKSEGNDLKPKLSEEEVKERMRSMAYAMHEPISDVGTTPIPVQNHPRITPDKDPAREPRSSTWWRASRKVQKKQMGAQVVVNARIMMNQRMNQWSKQSMTSKSTANCPRCCTGRKNWIRR